MTVKQRVVHWQLSVAAASNRSRDCGQTNSSLTNILVYLGVYEYILIHAFALPFGCRIRFLADVKRTIVSVDRAVNGSQRSVLAGRMLPEYRIISLALALYL